MKEVSWEVVYVSKLIFILGGGVDVIYFIAEEFAPD